MRITADGSQALAAIARWLGMAKGEGARAVAVKAVEVGVRDSVAAIHSAKADPTTGAGWAPWKESTRRAYERQAARMKSRRVGGGLKLHSLLWRTGAMVGTIVGEYELTGNGAVIGLGVSDALGAHRYAPAHQFGRENMVARPFVGITPGGQQEIKDFAEQRLLGDTA